MRASTIVSAITVAGALFASGAAHAATCATVAGDVQWDVSGTFVDGGTVSGCFYVNVYGYADNTTPWSLTTTTVGGYPGYVYDTANTYIGRVGNIYDFGSTATSYYLQLDFTGALTSPVPGNAITPADSYECYGASTCYLPAGTGTYRYLSTSVASTADGTVPEPAAWALLTVGAALAGGALRRRRVAAAA